MKKIQIILIVFLLFFTACLKSRELLEDEENQIENYISELGLPFEKSDNGIYYHVSTLGGENDFQTNDSVSIECTGFNLDATNTSNIYGYEIFAENETYKFATGDKNIMEGWNDALSIFNEGGVGILIFPYNKAYGKKQIGTIPPYSTLVFYFRINSDNELVQNTSLFHQYILSLDSVTNQTDNSVFYTSYFEGIGNSVSENQDIEIRYLSNLIDQTVVDTSQNLSFTVGSNLVLQGLSEGILLMKEGSMGQIHIPPSMAYGDNPPSNIPSNSTLIYELRVLSDDADIMEDSEMKKYFYYNPSDVDSITTNGIYYFETNAGNGEQLEIGMDIKIICTEQILNNDQFYGICDTCELTLGSDSFVPGFVEGLQLMNKGGKANFIIPYNNGYGNTQNGDIPAFSTLFYTVEIIE